MTADTHLGMLIRHDQKVAVCVVMYTVTGRALQFTVAIQLQLLGQSVNWTDLGVLGRQQTGIDKTDRMVIGQVRSEIGIAGCDINTTGASFSRVRQCDRAIMTTETQFAVTSGLAHLGIQGGTLINLVNRR